MIPRQFRSIFPGAGRHSIARARPDAGPDNSLPRHPTLTLCARPDAGPDNLAPTFPRGVCDTGAMPVGGRMESCPVHRAPPEGFPLSGVEVRPVTPRERPLRDALMDRHHHPGLRRAPLAARPIGSAASTTSRSRRSPSSSLSSLSAASDSVLLRTPHPPVVVIGRSCSVHGCGGD